jgi:DNA polymerase
MDKTKYLSALQESWSSCKACPLHEERIQTVFGYGNPDAQVMIIGEAPGENEDRVGIPFVGQAGLYLDQFLANVSADPTIIAIWERLMAIKGGNQQAEEARNEERINLREQLLNEFYICNVVMCRPPENRDPSPKEVVACSTRLHEQIYTVDPVLILAMGRIAAQAIIGKKIAITSARGQLFDVEFQGRGVTYRYPVMALLHPSYLLRINDINTKGGENARTYNSLLKAMALLDQFNLLHHGTPLPHRPQPEKI